MIIKLEAAKLEAIEVKACPKIKDQGLNFRNSR